MIKKGFVLFMALAMVLSYSVALTGSTARAASDGDLIKMEDHSAVYYLNGGKRYVFPNEKTYMTWYSDFSGVVTVSQSEMESYPLGGNVTYRPGTKLVKIDTVPTVYAVEPGGVLRSIVSEANAIDLYGEQWNQIIDDVPDSFWVNYTIGDPLEEGAYPTGQLVKEEGSATTYYIDGDMKRPVATGDAFEANMFKWDFIFTADDLSSYSDDSSITDMEEGLTTVAGSAEGTTPSEGTVSVSLSADTPATTTYIKSEARAPFLVLDFTNNSSDDVTVDAMTIERGGLSVDDDISSVSLYEDSVTGDQIGVSKTSWNSDDQMKFGGDLEVPAGTTKKVYVTGVVGSSANAGNTPKLGLVAADVKSGTLNGSLPIWGNQMNLNTSVVLAVWDITDKSSIYVDDTSPKVGDTMVEVAGFKVANNSSDANQDVELSKFVLKQSGSADEDDVDKYLLVKDETGDILAEATQEGDYVSFMLDSPYQIDYGDDVTLVVKANEITDGTNSTINLDIYNESDVVVKDLLYDAYVADNSGLSSSRPAMDTDDSYELTIGTGTLDVQVDGDFDEDDISENADNQQIAQWLFIVKGEPVDITELEANIITDSSASSAYADITNATFYNVETGDTYGTVDPNSTGGVTSTDTISLAVGTHKIGLEVDLNADFTSGDTIYAYIKPSTYVTAEGTISGQSITDSTTSNMTSPSTNGMTIKAGKLSFSLDSEGNMTAVKGTTGVDVATVQLDATGSGSDVSVSQLKLELEVTGMSSDELSNLALYDGNTEVTVSNDPDSSLSSTGGTNVTATFSISPTLTVEKGTVKYLDVKVNLASSLSNTDSFNFKTTDSITSRDAEGESITETIYETSGPTVSIADAGTLTITRVDQYENGYLNGNQTGLVIGKFNMKAAYDDVKVKKLYVDIAAVEGGGTDEFAAMYLYKGNDLVATASVTSTDQTDPVLFNMETDPYTVPVGETHELSLVVDTPVIDESGDVATLANPMDGFQPSISSSKVTLLNSNASVNSATLNFAEYVLVKSQPTVTVAASGDSLSGDGTYDIIDVTVAADSVGPIGLYKMKFKVTTTTVSVSSPEVYEGTTRVSSEATDGTSITYGDGFGIFTVLFNKQGYGGELRQISAGSSKTYSLRVTVSGFNSSNSNSVVTQLYGDADYLSADYEGASTAAADTNGDFVWSDLSYGNTSTTATTTVQWMNGHDVNGMLDTLSSSKAI